MLRLPLRATGRAHTVIQGNHGWRSCWCAHARCLRGIVPPNVFFIRRNLLPPVEVGTWSGTRPMVGGSRDRDGRPVPGAWLGGLRANLCKRLTMGVPRDRAGRPAPDAWLGGLRADWCRRFLRGDHRRWQRHEHFISRFLPLLCS